MTSPHAPVGQDPIGPLPAAPSDREHGHEPQDEARPQNTRRTIIITLLVLAVILGGLFLWRSLRTGGDQGWQAQDVEVAAMVAARQDVPRSLEAVGSLSAVREVLLAPEVAGRVSAIRFSAGDNVGANALLVQLYDGPEVADRRAAQARADLARLQLRRSETLAPSGAEPRQLLEERQSQLDQALAEVAQLDARIRQKQVRAPFAGQLGIRQIDPGEYLNAGAPVATLTALDRLFVDFSLPQQNIGLLKPGAEVTLSSDAYPGQSFTARVTSIEPRLDEDTRSVRVQATLANPGRILRPGMYVTAALVLPPQPQAIVLPLTAVQTSAQGESVIAIRGDDPRKGGKAEIVPVRTGARIGENIVIESGLKPGDVVVTQGQLRVQPGAAVKVARLGGAGVAGGAGGAADSATADAARAGAR